MAFTQTRFCGASVINFTAGLGWGDSSSSLSVGLVEDTRNGDSFNPGYVGKPSTFIFGGFTYTGIIQSYSRNINTSGETLEVNITDPREFLDGVPLILDGYIGDVSSLYNILNIYGYLESFGFGQSQKNESGIPWKFIRDSIHTLTNLTQQGVYGGPLYFIQSRYIVDLTLLPNLPDDFRVGSDSVSLLGFIREVCEAGGCDFYISMTEVSTGIFVIKVNTVSRTSVINYGSIALFLSQYPEFETKQIGFELQNETASKFLVGGSITDLWYQNADASVNTIWPFWGFDLSGDPIIGTGIGDAHQFTLDTRSVANPRVGPFYTTNVAEIRAVLAGRASWETFLFFNADNGGIHSDKARILNLSGYVQNISPTAIVSQLVANYNSNNGLITLDPGKLLFPADAQNLSGYEQLDWETGYLYDFLYRIASEYYGRKYMVAIPFTYAAVEPDTNKVRVSRLPVDSGYLEESLWPNAVANNLLPVEVDRFTEEDGRIFCFIRYNNGQFLDLSDLSPDSVSYNSRQANYGDKLQNISVFVRASVENSVVFLDKETQYGPRAIVTVDGIVRQRVVNGDAPSKDLIVKFLNDGFSTNGINTNTTAFRENVVNKFLNYIGQDIFNYGSETSAVTPDLAVVPLESQTSFYGPWMATGGAGTVDYEQDETLVPWNYGGWTALNLAAESKVNQAIGSNFQLEQGEITFPDAPFHNLGQPLLLHGPLVSDITVNIGTNGAHTTYRFRRNVKQPKYGQAKAERLARLSRRNQQIRRNTRLSNNPKRRESLERTATPINVITRQDHPKNKKTTSHEMLVGQIFTSESGRSQAAIYLQSDYNFTSHIKKDYDKKAYTSLDGLFVPYSTVYKSGFPSFVTPSGNATIPTVNHLNPYTNTFGSGPLHNVKIVAGGSGVPTNIYGPYIGADTGLRPIALRGPLIVSGPAYNIDGYPVPNASQDGRSGQFAPSAVQNHMDWPTGPVDLRWDAERGVFVTGTSDGLIRATSTSFFSVGGSGSALLSNGNTVNVLNWLGQPVCNGDNLYLSKEGSNYYLVMGEFKAVQAMSSLTCVNGTLSGTINTLYLPAPYMVPSGGFSC